MDEVTVEEARALIAAAMEWAADRGLKMAVAVVDRGGHPVAMGRMDGASILAAESVLQKARAAAWLGRPTTSAVEIGKEWPHVYLSFAIATQGAITLSKGGFPIVRGEDGVTLGSIGSAGATGEQDEACSLAALEARGYVSDRSAWPAGP